MTMLSRGDVLGRMRQTVVNGQPIIGSGAGMGLSAKCAEQGGADLIIIYQGDDRRANRAHATGVLGAYPGHARCGQAHQPCYPGPLPWRTDQRTGRRGHRTGRNRGRRGVFHFDALRFVLAGDAQTAQGQTWRPPWTQYSGDTWVTCSFEFPREVRALYSGSLEAPGAQDPWQGVWRIDCERGALHLADLGRGYGLYLSRFPDTFDLLESFGAPPSPGSGIPGTLRELAAALREGRRPQSDGRDNLRTLAMAFGVSRSSADGRAVALEREFFADQGATGS